MTSQSIKASLDEQYGIRLTDDAAEDFLQETHDINEIYKQILDYDLKTIGQAYLPKDMGSQTALSGKNFLQVAKVRDVTIPLRKSKDDTDDADDADEFSVSSRPNAHRLLRIEATDGERSVVLVEFTPMKSLQSIPLPGTKILVKDLPIKHSMGYLSEKNFQVLGGCVESLRKEYNIQQGEMDRSATKSAGGPPPFVPFKQTTKAPGGQMTQATQLSPSATPSSAKPTNLPSNAKEAAAQENRKPAAAQPPRQDQPKDRNHQKGHGKGQGGKEEKNHRDGKGDRAGKGGKGDRKGDHGKGRQAGNDRRHDSPAAPAAAPYRPQNQVDFPDLRSAPPNKQQPKTEDHPPASKGNDYAPAYAEGPKSSSKGGKSSSPKGQSTDDWWYGNADQWTDRDRGRGGYYNDDYKDGYHGGQSNQWAGQAGGGKDYANWGYGSRGGGDDWWGDQSRGYDKAGDWYGHDDDWYYRDDGKGSRGEGRQYADYGNSNRGSSGYGKSGSGKGAR